VNVLWQCPPEVHAALVLAHGAGAGMTHRSMQAIADAFSRRGIATLRFNFPFMEAGRNRVDSQPVAVATIAEAFAAARDRTQLPLFAGGHSFGGRMSSHAVASGAIDPVGLVFCSFPLHGAGKPSTDRAAHLPAIAKPMLFLSGTRDALAERDLLERVVGEVATAELHWLATADHGYRVQKRARASDEDVFDEMARVAADFVQAHASRPLNR
jgi:predicted alpha/beta-hydrolase family hydrolase